MKKLFLALLFTPVCLTAFAESEGALWLGADATKSLGTKWEVGANAGFRLANNFRTAERWDVGVSAQFKPIKGLKLGAGYDFIRDWKDEETTAHYNKSGVYNGYNVYDAYWRSKHRLHFDVTGSWKFGRFTLSWRERYQYTRFMEAETWEQKYRGTTNPLLDSEGYDTKKAKNRHSLRSRLALKYNIRHCPVTPGISYEIYNDLANGFHLDKHRVRAGIDWKINKNCHLGAGYIFQHGNGDEDENGENIHVIDVGFSYSF